MEIGAIAAIIFSVLALLFSLWTALGAGRVLMLNKKLWVDMNAYLERQAIQITDLSFRIKELEETKNHESR